MVNTIGNMFQFNDEEALREVAAEAPIERTIGDQVVRGNRAFWYAFDLENTGQRMLDMGFPVAAVVEYARDQKNGAWEDKRWQTLGFQYGVDVSRFMGSGSGGSGSARAERIKSLAARIKNDSRTLGIVLDDEKIAYIATVAEKLNYTEDQVRDDILRNVDWNTVQGGDLKAQIDLVKALSKSYLISVDDATAKDYSLRMSSGELSQDGLNNIFRAQALAANPWAKTAIEQGLTPADLLKNHQQYVAQSFEIDPGTVDLTDDQYLKLMTVDDGAGNSRVATLGELRSNVRKDSRWATTSEAKEIGSSMATMVARIFGRSSF